MKPDPVIDPPEKKKKKAPYPIFERRREPYAIAAGILGTILFHLLFFASLPHGVWSLGPMNASSHREKDLEIQLAPVQPLPKQKEGFCIQSLSLRHHSVDG